jgi:hypothetical protein
VKQEFHEGSTILHDGENVSGKNQHVLAIQEISPSQLDSIVDNKQYNPIFIGREQARDGGPFVSTLFQVLLILSNFKIFHLNFGNMSRYSFYYCIINVNY